MSGNGGRCPKVFVPRLRCRQVPPVSQLLPQAGDQALMLHWLTGYLGHSPEFTAAAGRYLNMAQRRQDGRRPVTGHPGGPPGDQDDESPVTGACHAGICGSPGGAIPPGHPTRRGGSPVPIVNHDQFRSADP